MPQSGSQVEEKLEILTFKLLSGFFFFICVRNFAAWSRAAIPTIKHESLIYLYSVVLYTLVNWDFFRIPRSKFITQLIYSLAEHNKVEFLWHKNGLVLLIRKPVSFKKDQRTSTSEAQTIIDTTCISFTGLHALMYA